MSTKLARFYEGAGSLSSSETTRDVLTASGEVVLVLFEAQPCQKNKDLSLCSGDIDHVT